MKNSTVVLLFENLRTETHTQKDDGDLKAEMRSDSGFGIAFSMGLPQPGYSSGIQQRIEAS
jgi:hypothetical protein